MKDASVSPIVSGAPYSRKRTVPRYIFVAVARITDSSTQTCILGRLSELSRKGCFVDTINPLPVGTPLQIVISRDQGSFATNGRVIYVQDAIGMGVGFHVPAPDQLKILDGWLANRPPSEKL